MKVSSCKICEEKIFQTGNYTINYIPAKRIPKKAKKMFENRNNSSNLNDSFWGMSKFQKYLKKRYLNQNNTIELTCKVCLTKSKIHMRKNKLKKWTGDEKRKCEQIDDSTTSSGKKSKKKKRRKGQTPSDSNAGLFLSFNESSLNKSDISSASLSPHPHSSSSFTASKLPSSASSINQPSCSTEETSLINSTSSSYFYNKSESKEFKKKKEKNEKRKEMDGIRKALFKSKSKASSSLSLKDFLSQT